MNHHGKMIGLNVLSIGQVGKIGDLLLNGQVRSVQYLQYLLDFIKLRSRNAGQSGLVEVHNISNNSVYKIAIKLIYDNTNEIFNYSGLQASQKLILVPSKAVQDKKLKKVIIRFVTPGNETGYCFYDGSYRYQDDSLKFVHPIYKYKKTSNHEVMVNSDMNENFLTSKDLKNLRMSWVI